MSKVGKIILAGLLMASVGYQSTAAMAAAAAAAPAAAAVPAKPAVAVVKGPAATGVICQVATSGKFVHIMAVNKGTAAVPVGDTFAFTIVGPTKKTSETYIFKTALAAGKSVAITNAIKVASVASCTPAG